MMPTPAINEWTSSSSRDWAWATAAPVNSR
jgi:hypothetical protein